MKRQTDIDLIHFFKRSYYIKAHLCERLDEFGSFASFANLQKVLEKTIGSLNLQLKDLDRQFENLGVIKTMDECEFLFPLLESVFTMIQTPNNKNSILSLLDYISIADTLLAETAKMTELYQDPSAVIFPCNYPVYSDVTLQPLIRLLEEKIMVA